MSDSATTGEDRTTLSGLWWFFATACLLTWTVWIPLVLSRREMLPFTLPVPYFVVFGLPLGGVACAVVCRFGAATLSRTGDRFVATAPLALDTGCARREHSP